MNRTDVIIEGGSTALGIITAGLVAYYSNNPTLSLTIGAIGYYAGRLLGRFDPHATPQTATVTQSDIQDAVQTIKDFHEQNTAAMGADVLKSINDLADVIKTVKPIDTAPAPIPTGPTAVPGSLSQPPVA